MNCAARGGRGEEGGVWESEKDREPEGERKEKETVRQGDRRVSQPLRLSHSYS